MESTSDQADSPLRHYVGESPVAHSNPTHRHLSTSNTEMWAISGSGSTFAPCESANATLPAGQYIVGYNDAGIYFEKRNIKLDNLLSLPDDESDSVISAISDFWKSESKFRQFGFLWKRGVLLWGPPGSGKTSVLQRISQQIISTGGISIYCECPRDTAKGLQVLRQIEPHRQLVVMLEDVDALIQNGNENALLALLDGELQVDNVVFIATTNYPELLDKRIKNRPSRFDMVCHIGMPSRAARTIIIKDKYPDMDEVTLDKWLHTTKNWSFAHIKELVISVGCLGIDFDVTVKRLNSMISSDISSNDDAHSTGFGFSKN